MIENIDRNLFETRASEFFKDISALGNIASAGMSYGDTAQKDALLKEAESRMYEVKRKSRNSGR